MNQWDSDAPPKYVNNTHLSARVGRLNPDWNEDSSGRWWGCTVAVGVDWLVGQLSLGACMVSRLLQVSGLWGAMPQTSCPHLPDSPPPPHPPPLL